MIFNYGIRLFYEYKWRRIQFADQIPIDASYNDINETEFRHTKYVLHSECCACRGKQTQKRALLVLTAIEIHKF